MERGYAALISRSAEQAFPVAHLPHRIRLVRGRHVRTACLKRRKPIKDHSHGSLRRVPAARNTSPAAFGVKPQLI